MRTDEIRSAIRSMKHIMIESGVIPEKSLFMSTYGWDYLMAVWDEDTRKEFLRLWDEDDNELFCQMVILHKFNEVC